MKVYRLNEYEWIAGPDPFSAVRWYLTETGVSAEEGIDENARELTENEMDSMVFVDREGEFGNEGAEYTFRDALGMMLRSRKTLGAADGEPFLFASTEY